jgi:hypothetical protein
LQDDLVKFVSEPTPPPQLVEVPEEGKAKAKERREVGEGDVTIVVEDTSEEDDDEETLQEPTLPLLIAELEARVDQLKASETDLKNLFYREQEARQVLEYDYKELAYECDKHNGAQYCIRS